jgi:hypothetical protein
MAHKHLGRQPTIVEDLIETLKANVYRSYRANVLDLLSLFPSMSHRHSAQLQLCNNTEATLDKIWKTVEDVWAEMSSSEVARGFVLTFRVLRLIIQEEDINNSCLAHGTPHCNVRHYYIDTTTGIVTN